jgi:hypothetical protein
MKKSTVIFICMLVFVVGSAFAYRAGYRKGLRQAEALVWSDYLERAQLNGEYEARAYLRCLQDIDSEDISNLHEFALGHLRYYVWDVQQRREEGYTWAPHIQWLYSNATVYVAEHPRKASDKTHQPNRPRQPLPLTDPHAD